MENLPTWTELDGDIRRAVLIKADWIHFFLNCNSKRSNRAVAAFIGADINVGDGNFYQDCADDAELLKSIPIKETMLHHATRRMYTLLSDCPDVPDIDVSEEKADGADWIEYFLGGLPNVSMLGDDMTYLPALRTLEIQSAIRLNLIEFIQDFVTSGDMGIGFSAATIADMARVDIRSVRNVMGPSIKKPITTVRDNRDQNRSSEFVRGNPLDAVEWLAGRRGFSFSHKLPAKWVNDCIEGLSQSPANDVLDPSKAVPAIPGLMAWLQKRTTQDMAKDLQWEPERLSAWFRGDGIDPSTAAQIAEMTGLDVNRYTNAIQTILERRQSCLS